MCDIVVRALHSRTTFRLPPGKRTRPTPTPRMWPTRTARTSFDRMRENALDHVWPQIISGTQVLALP